ncbi:hypothetical protein ACFLQN_01390 [Candidatus Aenigmatarchaeota archaeon]
MNESFKRGKIGSALLNKNVIFLGVLVLGLVLLSVSISANPDTATIHVGINQLNQITLQPDSLNWSNVTLGGRGGFKYIDIRNTGSINITNTYAYVDTITGEATRPYESDQAIDYSAGGVLLLRNETETGINWVGRIEWNWTSNITNTNLTDITNGTDAITQGFFRNASNQYHWAVRNGTNTSDTDGLVNGTCNTSNTRIAIEDDPDNGTLATRTPTANGFTYDGGAAAYGWGIWSFDRNGHPLDDHCFAINYTCDKIYIYKYDQRSADGFDDCSQVEFVLAPDLSPGKEETMTLDVHIPLGMPDGTMTSTTLTITGTGTQ